MSDWVAYVDESGSGMGQGSGPRRFVLACVAGSPAAIEDLAEKVRRLKLELVPGIDPSDWELHAGDMFHDRGGSPLGSLGMETKMPIMRRIANIVRDSDVVPLGVVLTGASMHGKRATDAKIIAHATSLLAERLERLAQGVGDRVTLRLVSDNAPEGQRLAMKRALDRQAGGWPPSRGGARAVTGIEFVDSLRNALVQVADALAYIINRHAGGDAMFEELFGIVDRKACSCREWNRIRLGSGRRSGSTRSRRP